MTKEEFKKKWFPVDRGYNDEIEKDLDELILATRDELFEEIEYDQMDF